MNTRWKWPISILALTVVLLMVQSATITVPLAGTLVDAQTGSPITNAVVVAIWELDQLSFDSSLASSTVKTFATSSGADGSFIVPGAWILHTPLMPFSLWSRSHTSMPLLVLVPRQATYVGDVKAGPWAGRQRFEIDSSTSTDFDAAAMRQFDVSALRQILEQAAQQCAAARWCQRGDLQPALAALW